MKILLSGNEAISYGAAEAGISVMAGYPGLPSTEIIETAKKFKSIYCEWSSNEKVAFDVGIGASMAGSRVILTMKDLGLNVAADSFFGIINTKINGALIIVVCDDSGREQGDDMNDARHFAYMGDIPMLEPASAQEAKDFVHYAVEISEKYFVPVIIRMTAIVTHSQEIVDVNEERISESYHNNSEIRTSKMNSVFQKNKLFDWKKSVCNDFKNTPINICKYKNNEIGFLGSGVSILHAIEAFPDASIFKLGLTNPLPLNEIKEFFDNVTKVYIVEESHPILEQKIKASGLSVLECECFRRTSKPFYLTPTNIYETINKVNLRPIKSETKLPMQLPVNCPGCPHTFLFTAFKELKLNVMGDSGCYALNLYPPINSMNIFLCMGSSVNMTHGVNMSTGCKNVVAVMGDGVFYHSGINGIINLVYNKGTSTVIIADNGCIAMTGGQKTLASECSIEAICEAVGIKHIKIIDPYDVDKMKKTILEEIEIEEPSVIISRHPCLQKVKVQHNKYYYINKEECKGCYKCTKIGCLAISRKDNKAVINKQLCVGCSLCLKTCDCTAIKEGFK